ncbi:uncharacterized protein DNG_09706 [Cephalotrichum gorgonifer]|uniref:Uncharacterized protein n=1 Tax=Cephalotrichum gorgonifer TaxID=2041049 RepID=A0AAE8N6C7_9PEZI|nr:uncharacterized protein DNG_09706 [Cephalotrichum gorgonifer]
MSSHIVTADTPLSTAVLGQISLASALDEISNVPGAVRSHIFWWGMRDKKTGKLRKSMLFFVYQTTRYGPQNGFRLCLVHQGYYIASKVKADGEPEDEIDRLEKDIPQGHMEVVVLGEPTYIDDP